MRICVVGAGSWGTALAQCLDAGGHSVCLWGRDVALADRLQLTRRGSPYLPAMVLRNGVDVTADVAVAALGAELAILAVPTHGMRGVASQFAAALPLGCAVVSAAKGFEVATEQTMSAVLAEVFGAGRALAVMSGPNIAVEVAAGMPAACVVASRDVAVAGLVRDALAAVPNLRPYSSQDVVGVECAGALKNIVAIAAGAADGLGVGDNAKAAIVTRGIAEMTRLGVRLGARPLTFAGLAGLGDCIVTCMSAKSRNRSLGEQIGRGRTLAEVTEGMAMVAEGVNATRVARRLARSHGEDMPIVDAVAAVLFEAKPVTDALADLMRRNPADEARP